MATASTGWTCAHSASIVSQTNTTATIRVTCYWQNAGYTYNINNVSAWTYLAGVEKQVKTNGSVNSTSSTTAKVSMGYYDYTINKTTSKQSISYCAKITSNSSYVSGTKWSSTSTISVAAKPSYTVKYDANGGTGAPSSQTKWYGTNLKLSTTKPTRTGYTFEYWSNGQTTFQPGATYADNAGLTLYAKWKANTYDVIYDANGGINAPDNQTKTYGEDLTLSSDIPTKTDYNFLGWSTSVNGGVVYEPGDTYTNDGAITLYAVWELAYVKPRLTNFSVQRCTSAGVIAEDGTYVKVEFDWATDNPVIDIQIQWKIQNGETWSSYDALEPGTSGSISQIVGGGNISTESTYIFRAYVSDRETDGTTKSPDISIGTIKYPIDVYKKGEGVAFGKAAEEANLVDSKWPIKLGGGLKPVLLEANTNLDELKTPNFYTGKNLDSNSYSNCPLTSGTFYLEVVSTGDEGQVRQTITSGDKTNIITYQRFYYENAWGDWIQSNNLSGVLIPDGTSLNSVNIVGDYISGDLDSYSYTNLPTSSLPTLASSFNLKVIPVGNNGELQQILTSCNKTNSVMYQRFYCDDEWGNWEELLNVNKKRQYIYYVTRKDTTVSTGAWVDITNTITTADIIPPGHYLVTFRCHYGGGANGMCTFNPFLDGTKLSAGGRSTVPVVNGLTSSAQMSIYRHFTTASTHTAKVQAYTNASGKAIYDSEVQFLRID